MTQMSSVEGAGFLPLPAGGGEFTGSGPAAEFPAFTTVFCCDVKGTIESDEELVSALAAGDPSAMTPLFHRYRRLVYCVALGIVGDLHEAEDVVQIVFFDVFRAATRYSIVRGSAKTWLLQYAYHRALHRRRQLASRHFYLWEDVQSPGPASEISLRPPSHPELILSVRQAISRLNPRQRMAIELAYYEGLTATEISQRTKQTAHVVRHDLRRAMIAMRGALDDAKRREA